MFKQIILTYEVQIRWKYITTVECRYNSIQYYMILHTSRQWLRQNIHQNLNAQAL